MNATRHLTTSHSGVGDLARDPVVWSDLLQVVKTVVAAVAAWLVAVYVLDLAQPFLAPWAALLVVHATVYRTVSRGIQQVGAVVLGVLLAFGVSSVLGVSGLALALVLVVALLVGTAKPLRSEAATAATTALVVLLTGDSDETWTLLDRLADTGVGIAFGLLVNLLAWAPLHDRSAARQVDAIDDAIGALLLDMASDLRDAPSAGDEDGEPVDRWIERTRDLDESLDHAWTVVRQATESGRLNPRRRARLRHLHTERWEATLRALEQAIAETRSMARTVGKGSAPDQHWDSRFHGPWLDLLEQTGRVVSATDPATLSAVKSRLHELASELSQEDLPGLIWPVYGALIVNLRNITTALDEVARAQPTDGGRSTVPTGA